MTEFRVCGWSDLKEGHPDGVSKDPVSERKRVSDQ